MIEKIGALFVGEYSESERLALFEFINNFSKELGWVWGIYPNDVNGLKRLTKESDWDLDTFIEKYFHMNSVDGKMSNPIAIRYAGSSRNLVGLHLDDLNDTVRVMLDIYFRSLSEVENLKLRLRDDIPKIIWDILYEE